MRVVAPSHPAAVQPETVLVAYALGNVISTVVEAGMGCSEPKRTI